MKKTAPTSSIASRKIPEASGERSGIIVPLSTPLKEDGDDFIFDKDGMKKLIEHVISGGVQGVFVLGSCGEYPCFDDMESKTITEFVVNEVRGRVPVYANISRNSTRHTLAIAESFQCIGVDYMVVMPPFYYSSMQQTDLVNHFLAVAKNNKVVLYNHPNATKIPISIDALRELSKVNNIVAMKDSSGDISYFRDAAKLMPCFCGSDNLLLESLKLGGIGGVPGLANIIPKTFVRLYSLFKEGKIKEADELQKEINLMNSIVYKTPKNAQVGVKQALSYLGICKPFMRPPIAQITAGEAKIINDYLSKSKLICFG